MKIAYYITAHGYGHGVRSVAIAGHFPPGVDLVFRTELPRRFFAEELERPFDYSPAAFDCGCLQSDAVTVDVAATVARYSAIARDNSGRLGDEVRWLRDNGIDGVIADMPPFALEAASVAGIPSAIVTNFTWYHIYREYLALFPEFGSYVDNIRRQYSLAGLMLEAYPSMDMSLFPDRAPVEVVGRAGTDRRNEIRARYGIAPHKRIGLIYTGTFGMDRVRWERLEEFRDWEFLGILPLPGSPGNYRLVPKSQIRYQDLCASVDAVISKIGYGTFAESVLHGVALLYVPRADFAEFPVLESALHQWGHGWRVEGDDFNAVRWHRQLAAVTAHPRPVPWPNTGAHTAAALIGAFFSRG